MITVLSISGAMPITFSSLPNYFTVNVCFNFVLKFIPCLGTAVDFCQNTGPFNVTGHPALSINTGFSEGLPVGMMIVGRKFEDATVLNVAYAYEKIRDELTS